MQHLIRLDNYTKEDVFEIFRIADEVKEGKYGNFLAGKTVLLFFPNSSIRTRVAFEKGVHMLGGETILFPPDALDKREKMEDVVKYLNNWVDVAVIRHKDIGVLEEIATYAAFPVINALTDVNHPCEIISDLYAFSKVRNHFCNDRFLFVGAKGNVGETWQEAARVMSFELRQCCPKGYEIEGVEVIRDLRDAVKGTDIVCTDSLTHGELHAFKNYQVTMEIMNLANGGAMFNPCPPFYRGEEVAEDVVNSPYFVGYEFKGHLLEVHQAILIFSLLH